MRRGPKEVLVHGNKRAHSGLCQSPMKTNLPFLGVLAALPIIASSVALTGCKEQSSSGTTQGGPVSPQAPEHPVSTDATPKATRPLTAELEALKASFEQRAPADRKALYDAGTQAVIDAGIVERAKSMGDQAPGFTLTNQTGQPVSLSALLEQGPVVLTWYRGGWCPYCNLTLRAYQDRLADFTALGATLVALTPELPDKSISTAEKQGLAFQVLSDTGNAVAREYGVVFKLTDGVHQSYEKGFGLSQFNGDDSGELPLAATYVIDRQGTIRWAFLDADYQNRAEPADVLAALRRLSARPQGG